VIESEVNAAREVVAPIHIGRAEVGTRNIEAVIDTGYGGFFTLPE
jgi:predicted aspartyl protease